MTSISDANPAFPWHRFGTGQIETNALAHRMPGGLRIWAIRGDIVPQAYPQPIGWSVLAFESDKR